MTAVSVTFWRAALTLVLFGLALVVVQLPPKARRIAVGLLLALAVAGVGAAWAFPMDCCSEPAWLCQVLFICFCPCPW